MWRQSSDPLGNVVKLQHVDDARVRGFKFGDHSSIKAATSVLRMRGPAQEELTRKSWGVAYDRMPLFILT